MALREAGYVEFDVGDGDPPFWRRPGSDPIPWKQAMIQMATQLNRAEAELASIKAARPKPGWLSTEFLLSLVAGAPMVFVTMGGQLEDLAKSLPAPWGNFLQIGAGGVVALITVHYGRGRNKAKSASATGSVEPTQ